jgi:hypothetical protein
MHIIMYKITAVSKQNKYESLNKAHDSVTYKVRRNVTI